MIQKYCAFLSEPFQLPWSHEALPFAPPTGKYHQQHHEWGIIPLLWSNRRAPKWSDNALSCPVRHTKWQVDNRKLVLHTPRLDRAPFWELDSYYSLHFERRTLASPVSRTTAAYDVYVGKRLSFLGYTKHTTFMWGEQRASVHRKDGTDSKIGLKGKEHVIVIYISNRLMRIRNRKRMFGKGQKIVAHRRLVAAADSLS